MHNRIAKSKPTPEVKPPNPNPAKILTKLIRWVDIVYANPERHPARNQNQNQKSNIQTWWARSKVWSLLDTDFPSNYSSQLSCGRRMPAVVLRWVFDRDATDPLSRSSFEVKWLTGFTLSPQPAAYVACLSSVRLIISSHRISSQPGPITKTLTPARGHPFSMLSLSPMNILTSPEATLNVPIETTIQRIQHIF